MNQVTKFIFSPLSNQEIIRLDLFLSEQLQISRSQVQKLIKADRVLVNGKLPKKAGDQLKSGARIDIQPLEAKEEYNITANEQMTINTDIYKEILVIAEEVEYLVVYKPAGLLVHETDAGEPVTLAGWLVEQYPELQTVGEDHRRPGIVHRLDKEASGLLVVARTQKMFNLLKAQFKARTVEKEYVVLVHGAVALDHGMIDFPIDRGREGRMVARPKLDVLQVKNISKAQPGKDALTEYDVEQRFPHLTLLNVKIHTGRMHQIRVHFFAFNYPVVGDQLYFRKKQNRKMDAALGRLFLHAKRLCFVDLAGERVCFECPLPAELQSFLSDV